MSHVIQHRHGTERYWAGVRGWVDGVGDAVHFVRHRDAYDAMLSILWLFERPHNVIEVS